VKDKASSFFQELLKETSTIPKTYFKKSSLFGETLLDNPGSHNCGITFKEIKLHGFFSSKDTVVIKCVRDTPTDAFAIEYYRHIHQWKLPFVETLAFGWSWNKSVYYIFMKPVIPIASEIKTFLQRQPSPEEKDAYIKDIQEKASISLALLFTKNLKFVDKQFANIGLGEYLKKKYNIY